MTKENLNVLQGVFILFVSCVFIGLYSYIFDLIHNYPYASQNFIYLPYYIFWYLISRSLGIIPLIVLYYLLSKNSKNIVLKVLVILIVTAIATMVGKYLGNDDLNLSIHTREYKNIPVYAAAALSTCIFYEWLIWRNNKKDTKNKN